MANRVTQFIVETLENAGSPNVRVTQFVVEILVQVRTKSVSGVDAAFASAESAFLDIFIVPPAESTLGAAPDVLAFATAEDATQLLTALEGSLSLDAPFAVSEAPLISVIILGVSDETAIASSEAITLIKQTEIIRLSQQVLEVADLADVKPILSQEVLEIADSELIGIILSQEVLEVAYSGDFTVEPPPERPRNHSWAA